MHKKKVYIIGSEILERLVQSPLDILRGMLGVPELACDENIGSGDAALSNSLSNLSLISVDGCTVDMSVSSSKSSFYGAFDFIRCCLPSAKAHGGYTCTTVQCPMRRKSHVRIAKVSYGDRASSLDIFMRTLAGMNLSVCFRGPL